MRSVNRVGNKKNAKGRVSKRTRHTKRIAPKTFLSEWDRRVHYARAYGRMGKGRSFYAR